MAGLSKQWCNYCNKDLAPRTVRRHARIGCPGSPRRRAILLQSIRDLLANRQRPIPPGPRHYHRQHFPRSPPPRPLVRSPSPPSSPSSHGQTSRPAKGPREPPDTDSQPRKRAQTNANDDIDVDAELERLRQPNLLFCRLESNARPRPVKEIPDKRMQAILRGEPWLKGLTTNQILKMRAIGDLVKKGSLKLCYSNLCIVQAFNYKVDTDISGRAFSKLARAFPEELGTLPTKFITRSCASFLSGFDPIHLDCCINSCIAYTGKYEQLSMCHHCAEGQYALDPDTGNARPRRTFQYLPIIPQLVQM
ncbi:hypothetical protein RhiJN_09427 [Ceratobasidium sp. AG-Ba]|nr:hypothetical protein RhiJN_09427 [Ceratobasidium sp. AG-Ba]